MNITTQFDIHNLVKHKFSKSSSGNNIQAYEVIEIGTVTCIAGTQNFYTCRIVAASKRREDEIVSCTQEEIRSDDKWDCGPAISQDEGLVGYAKLDIIIG